MPVVDQVRGERLVALARERFDSDLSAPEQRILLHSAGYSNASLSQQDLQPQTVRASLIRWLATDAEASKLLDPQGIRIQSATFTEPLDFNNCIIATALSFVNCAFNEPFTLRFAETRGLFLREVKAAKGIDGDHASIRGSLDVEGLLADGGVTFRSAKIEGRVRFENSKLSGPVTSLLLDTALVRGDVLLKQFESTGTVSLLGAEIGGDFLANQAVLNAPADLSVPDAEAVSVAMDLSKIVGSISLHGARASDEVRFSDANIGGTVEFQGARLEGGKLPPSADASQSLGTALSLDGTAIRGSVFLNAGFYSEGIVRVDSASVGGDISCNGSTVPALNATKAEVKGYLWWTGIENADQSSLSLDGASLGGLRDDRESWPGLERLSLNGVALGSLILHARLPKDRIDQSVWAEELPFKAEERVHWLNRQRNLLNAEPQPWMHLAEMFEAKGDRPGGKRIVYALRNHQAAASKGPVERYWKMLLAELEREPMLILISIALFTLLGTAVFWRYEAHFSPTAESAYQAAHSPHAKPADAPAYPKFQPVVYALENVLPVVRLGQDDKWAPDARLGSSRIYWSLMALRWFLILSGWAQGVVLGAAVSGRFRD